MPQFDSPPQLRFEVSEIAPLGRVGQWELAINVLIRRRRCNYRRAALKGPSLRGWVASSMWNKPERFTYNRDLILHGPQEKRLRPVIAKVFSLQQIADAYRYRESNQHPGKVVITV